MAYSTPILLITWRRPHLAKRQLDALRQQSPTSLYIASDGAREGNIAEEQKVLQTRDIFEKNINWECQVKTLYSKCNKGCRAGVSSAISWFFNNVEEGIILEDDCIPEPDFFGYCENLLNRYRCNQKIGLVTGYNKYDDRFNTQDEYYFYARHGGIWGWASWADRWKYYESSIKQFNSDYAHYKYESLLGRKTAKIRINNLLNIILADNIDTWDYIWACDRNRHGLLACVPTKSLIKNIGIGDGATHTSNSRELERKIHQTNKVSGWYKKAWSPKQIKINAKYDCAHLNIGISLRARLIKSLSKALRQTLELTKQALTEDVNISQYKENNSQAELKYDVNYCTKDIAKVQIPERPISARNNKLFNYIFGKLLEHEAVDLYVHGSYADETTTAFSDIDDFVIVNDLIIRSGGKQQKKLSKLLAESERKMSRIDTLQHHGHFLSCKSELLSYDNSRFPLYILKNSIATGKASKEIVCTVDIQRTRAGLEKNLRATLMQTFELYMKYEDQKINFYDMKCLVGNFLICPAYSYQLQGDDCDKPTAIYRATQEFSTLSKELIDTCTVIRNQWPEVALHQKVLIKALTYTKIPPKAIRSFAKTMSNKFPIDTFNRLRREQLTSFTNDCLRTASLQQLDQPDHA